MEYSIGGKTFLDLSPAPDLIRTVLETVERPGVDGTAIWEVARRGQQQTLRSRVDVADVAGGMAKFDEYCGLVDKGPQIVKWADVSLDDYGVRYQVLDVRIADLSACGLIVGGLNGGTAWLECDWVVKPIPMDL